MSSDIRQSGKLFQPSTLSSDGEGEIMAKTSTSVAVIAVLAIAQAIFGVLRALGWFQMGSDFLGRGLLILPIIGLAAYARGFLVAGIALLYVLFALGAYSRKGWAWSLGVTVAVINVLLVLSVVIQGESLVRGVAWLVVPLVIICYLFSAAGREVFKS